MDRRRALDSGYIIEFRGEQNTAVYTIGHEIGRGSSCIVYDAFNTANNGDTKPARIKEYYPYKMHILRKEDGSLEVPEDETELFVQGKAAFTLAFHRQNHLFTVQGLTNSINGSVDIYKGNNTLYTVSTFAEGQTLEKRRPESLENAVKVVTAVAKAVGRIHDMGYLYLDIKPDNIFTFPETWDLIQLFDFDTLIDRTEPIENQRISYSKGFAALEQKRGDLSSIGPHTDVYGIGALLFWLIFDRCPDPFDCNINATFSFSDSVYRKSTFRDRLYYELTDFFHKTLASYYIDRYQNMDLTIDELRKILPFSDSKAEFIYSHRVPDQPFFTGRGRELACLHELVSRGHGAISVSGMGGIGKSSLVTQYLNIHRKEYDSVIYLDYQGSIRKLLLNDLYLRISTIRKMDFETYDEYYLRKIGKLKEIAAHQKILIVLDNYYSQPGDDFTDFFHIPWHTIVITREIDNTLELPQIRVTELETEEERISLFEKYLERRIHKDERSAVAAIIHKIQGHTLSLKLLAKHMAAGLMSLEEMSAFIENHKLDQIPGVLEQTKDLKIYQGKVNQLLADLMNMSQLTEPERIIMKQLGAFKMPGISFKDFRELTAGKSEQDKAPEPVSETDINLVYEQVESVAELVRKGWVEQYEEYLLLHPIIDDIVMSWNWTEAYRNAEQVMMQKLADNIRVDWKNFQNYQREVFEPEDESSKNDRVVDRERIEEYISQANQILEWYPFSDQSSQKLQYQMITVLPQSEEELILEKSKELLKKGKDLDTKEIIDLHYQIAYVLEQQNKLAASYRQVKKASVLVAGVNDSLVKAEHYFWLAGGAKENGDFAKAMDLLYQAEKLAYKSGTEKGMQKYAFYLTRNIHWRLGNIDSRPVKRKEIEHMLNEISSICKRYRVTDIDTISSYFMQLCMFECFSGKKEKQILENMEKGAANMQRLSTSDYFYIDNVSLFKFTVFQELGRFKEAQKVLEEAVELCDRHEDMLPYTRKKLDLLLDLACVHHNMNNRKMAKKYYDQIAEILENTEGLRMSKEFISDYETYRF